MCNFWKQFLFIFVVNTKARFRNFNELPYIKSPILELVKEF